MMRLKNELVHGEVLGIDEVIARIETVTLDDVRRQRRSRPNLVVGPRRPALALRRYKQIPKDQNSAGPR